MAEPRVAQIDHWLLLIISGRFGLELCTLLDCSDRLCYLPIYATKTVSFPALSIIPIFITLAFTLHLLV